MQDRDFRLIRLVVDGRGIPLPARAKITFTIRQGRRFTGQSVINSYSGSVLFKADGRLEFLRLTESTQMAGSPEFMDLEMAYFNALTAVQRFIPVTNGRSWREPISR